MRSEITNLTVRLASASRPLGLSRVPLMKRKIRFKLRDQIWSSPRRDWGDSRRVFSLLI